MSYREDLNDLAIMLTDKIYRELVGEQVSMGNFAPTYYNTRMKILKVLEEYIKVATVEHEYSPEMLNVMNNDSYVKHAEDKMLFKMTDFLSENKMFRISSKQSLDGWYRKDNLDLFVVDVNKLKKDILAKDEK